MSERKLEPTPGWCERAARALRAYRHIGDEGAEELYQEYEAAPKPAPLPHEMVSSFICPECKGSHFGTDSTSEDKSRWIVYCHDQWHRGCRWKGAYLAHVTQPAPLPHESTHVAVTTEDGRYICPARNEPPAEKAEALPELGECLNVQISGAKFDRQQIWDLKNIARALLAECRRIAREEALIAFRAGGSDEILSDMHRIARCEIEKSHIEALSGVCRCFPKRTTVSVDCLARHLRIVPGKEGEL